MQVRIHLFGLAVMSIATALGGCASQRSWPVEHPYRAKRARVHQPDSAAAALNLVMPSAAMLELEAAVTGDARYFLNDPARGQIAYEFSRNDASLGALPGAFPTRLSFVEVRHREYLRTSNARPREFTTTSTRTIERSSNW